MNLLLRRLSNLQELKRAEQDLLCVVIMLLVIILISRRRKMAVVVDKNLLNVRVQY